MLCMNKSNMLKKLEELPQAPGVYVFYNAEKEIVYIGKATNLRSRVQSYFRNTNTRINANDADMQMDANEKYARPIEMMIDQVANIEAQETDSVLEALILESNLIKKYQPKYNVKEKDDKSFSYFAITKEEFPKIIILRKTDLDAIRNSEFEIQNSGTYGPYTSKKQMEIALKIIRKIFPFHLNKHKTEKGCLDFQIGLCPGPYAGVISKQDYAKNIRGIKMILQGKKKSLIGKMEKEMEKFSKNQEFEKAAEIRNKIFALKHIRDVALINKDDSVFQNSKLLRIEAYDISNISGKQAVGSMVVFSGSEPDKSQYRKFEIKTVEGANDVAMMKEVLQRRFQNDWTMPDLILLDGGQGHLNMAEKLLVDLGLNIPLVAVAKGKTRKISNSKFLISRQSLMSKLSSRINVILNDRNLIKHITDEAHRFAIVYHRKKRGKELLG